MVFLGYLQGTESVEEKGIGHLPLNALKYFFTLNNRGDLEEIKWRLIYSQVDVAQLNSKDAVDGFTQSVASLGLVSPGAATDGVTPIFPENTGDLFSHRYKVMTFFSCRLVTTPIFRHRVVQCSL